MASDWSFLVGGPIASSPTAHVHEVLLAANVSFAQCLSACDDHLRASSPSTLSSSSPPCHAIKYVQQHGGGGRNGNANGTVGSSSSSSGGGGGGSGGKHMKRGCYLLHASAIHHSRTSPEHVDVLIAIRRSRARPPNDAKNVLLVVFDDLRVVDAPYAETFVPVARSFAATATTFLSAHAQTALCAPSRASFLSGRRPDITRVHWTNTHLRAWPAAASWATMPQHFREAGYYVAASGKLFHKMSDPASLDPLSWSEPACVSAYPYFGQGTCPEPADVLLKRFNTSVGCPVDASRSSAKYEAITDKHVLRKALEFLRGAAPAARKRARPFWLGVGFFKPHKPFVFPAEILRRVPSLEVTSLPTNNVPPRAMAPMASIPELCTAHGARSPEAGPGSRCARENVRMYHAAASFTDGLLGELLSELEAQRLHAETLVIVMSDHGFALGEHGAWAKWSNWEVATRVPLAIRAPWLPASRGARISTTIELLDLFPTIAELAGVPLPVKAADSYVGGGSDGGAYAGVGGRSLAKVFERPHNRSDGVAFSQIARCWPTHSPHDASSYAAMGQCDDVTPAEYAFMGYSIRTQTARLTEWVPVGWDPPTARHTPRWAEAVATELYDHSSAADLEEGWTQSSENDNIAASRPEDVAALRHRLRAHFDATLRQAAVLS